MTRPPAPDEAFWTLLDGLVATSEVVIERRAGTPHPRFPDTLYPLDYGYLRGTTGGDGAEVDVFLGSGEARVTGAVCTVDLRKRDAEVKVLLGCGVADAAAVAEFLNWPGSFACHVLLRGEALTPGDGLSPSSPHTG